MTNDKRKKMANKKCLEKMMGDTRNIKQIRQVNTNHSFTLKKFNQHNSTTSQNNISINNNNANNSGSIQMIKSFQP